MTQRCREGVTGEASVVTVCLLCTGTVEFNNSASNATFKMSVLSEKWQLYYMFMTDVTDGGGVATKSVQVCLCAFTRWELDEGAASRTQGSRTDLCLGWRVC